MQQSPPPSDPARASLEGSIDSGSAAPEVRPANDKAGLKLLIDLVPLAIFFVAFRFLGLIPATAVLVVATLISVVASKVLLGKVSPMLIVSAVLVTVFGGLTIGFNDPRFIKMKPTIVNLLFAGALGFGLVTGRNFLKLVLGEALHLTADGWRLLTYRWLGLFVGMAMLNEIVWRTWNTPETEYVWVNFKFPGMLVLTLVFTALQMPLLRRHAMPVQGA
jgi:intracellular septation protein